MYEPIAKNYATFDAGVQDHGEKNLDHRANGIRLSAHDMERLDFKEGETILVPTSLRGGGA